MSSPNRISKVFTIAALAACIAGCSEEHSTSAVPSANSASTRPEVSAPAPSATAPVASAKESGPVHDCPAGSTGDGSFNKPCEAKGTARMMEVAWTGKMTDTGPSFRVTNKSPSVILYGKVVAYFYDKAGKQLEVKDAGGKPRTNQPCTGNLFSGVMKPAEKAVITFSCVKKESVPEGTAQIEAEMQTVGFADASEKKSEWFWKNNDLTPDTRPKGGAKK